MNLVTNPRDAFLLESDVIFLNHGSFGATPSVVFERYQRWQRFLEAQPVRFLNRELSGYLAAARDVLAAYLNAPPQDISFVPNATFGVNVAAQSLKLGQGDEVLSSDQEYGACRNIWHYLSQRQGFRYREAAIPLGVSSEEMLEAFWSAVSEDTKVIFLSHITSATAQRLPIEAICQRAGQAGILSIIDGAHAPGQIDLDLCALQADIYTGNCHKWLCSPKGAGFLYVKPEKQSLIEPLVIGWGLSRSQEESLGSAFLDNYAWLGTADPAAYLSVPAAIEFQQQHDWRLLRQQCHELLASCLSELHSMTGLPIPYLNEAMYHQLAISPLPKTVNPLAFKERLYKDYRIEIPLTQHHEQPYLRISVQAYNSKADLQALTQAVTECIGRERTG